MKKLIATCTLSCLLLNVSMMGSASAASSAVQQPQFQARIDFIHQKINKFKSDVFAKGADFQVSLQKLSQELLESEVSVADLQLYVYENATEQEKRKFDEVVSLTLDDVDSLSELHPKELSSIVSEAVSAGTETGSNFMSCSTGLGIGIPLIAAGLVVGTIALIHATANKEVVAQKFLNDRKKMNEDYLNVKADLEYEISVYESDIVYYQDEIAELQRMIRTGQYHPADVEFFYQEIREYEFLISDARALIGEVNVDLDFFNSKFDADLDILNSSEENKKALVDKRKQNAGKLAIASGVSAGLGSLFVFAGSYDCN